jgi:chromosome segregation ATPase
VEVDDLNTLNPQKAFDAWDQQEWVDSTIRSLSSELEKAKAEITDLLPRLDADALIIEKAGEDIKALKSETATLKRQRDELVKAAKNFVRIACQEANGLYVGTVPPDVNSAFDKLESVVNSLGSGE